jgi:hypothetical protein
VQLRAALPAPAGKSRHRCCLGVSHSDKPNETRIECQVIAQSVPDHSASVPKALMEAIL